VAHIELTREIARRFNGLYKKKTRHLLPAPGPPGMMQGYPTLITEESDILVEPQPLLTPAARLRGSDGRKMSKSYGNSILLSDPPEQVVARIGEYVTDRTDRQEPGDPERCPVGDLHTAFSQESTTQWAFEGCRTAAISCRQCKDRASEELITKLEPIRGRRAEYERDPAEAWAIIERGSEKASAAARTTLLDVREGLNLSHGFDSLVDSYRSAWGKKSTYLFLPYEATESLIDPVKIGDARRASWLRFAGRDVHLKKTDVHRVYTNPRGKRVCIVTSGERLQGNHSTFAFAPRDRTYELLVLLFHLRDGNIIDFVIPGKVFQAFWKSLPREGKSVRLFATRRGDDFSLVLPNDNTLELNEFKSRYDLLS